VKKRGRKGAEVTRDEKREDNTRTVRMRREGWKRGEECSREQRRKEEQRLVNKQKKLQKRKKN
jgi:hypothetical protein